MVSPTHRLLHPVAKKVCQPLNRSLGGPHSRSEDLDEKLFCSCLEIQTTIPWSLTLNLSHCTDYAIDSHIKKKNVCVCVCMFVCV